MKTVPAFRAEPQIVCPPAATAAPAVAYATVAAAVQAAMTKYGNELAFGADVEKGVAHLHPKAGPPEKVYDKLEGLAKMVQVRRAGLLNAGMVGYLNQNGLRCSEESASVRRSFDGRRKRTFHDGEKRTFFAPHVKVSDGTRPDRCVRIYFDWREARQVAVVGWVGRHPE